MNLLEHLRPSACANGLADHRLRRGPVHSMLSGTPVEPPQLNEFMICGDAPDRIADLRELGWAQSDRFATG